MENIRSKWVNASYKQLFLEVQESDIIISATRRRREIKMLLRLSALVCNDHKRTHKYDVSVFDWK